MRLISYLILLEICFPSSDARAQFDSEPTVGPFEYLTKTKTTTQRSPRWRRPDTDSEPTTVWPESVVLTPPSWFPFEKDEIREPPMEIKDAPEVHPLWYRKLIRGHRNRATPIVQNSTIAKEKNWPAREDEIVTVHVGFYIESVGNLKTVDMAFDTDIYFRMSWKDYRLRSERAVKGLRILTTEEQEKIWIPDLFFANAKTAEFQSVLVPNRVMYIDEHGTVAYSARVVLDLACNLELTDYPLDRQMCKFRIMSYAHTEDQMEVRWFSSKPLDMNQEIRVPEYSITDFVAGKCNGTYLYAVTEEKKHMGHFSCLEARLYLKRDIGYHLVQTYVPTGCIVVVSWVGFFIDPNAVMARISLSFTTLLTLATQGAGLRLDLPAVSYAKAIDVWFGVCMVFVFAALVEFTIVNGYMRMSAKLETLASYNPSTHSFSRSDNDISTRDTIIIQQNMKSGVITGLRDSVFLQESKLNAIKGLRIDKFSRFMFPLFFVMWNIFYWTYYTDA